MLKLAFHDTDTNTDTDILATILRELYKAHSSQYVPYQLA